MSIADSTKMDSSSLHDMTDATCEAMLWSSNRLDSMETNQSDTKMEASDSITIISATILGWQCAYMMIQASSIL